jgi:SAM-dependent methyltransferase
MADYEVLHLDQNEKVILEVRRHWIVFLNEIILFIFAVFSLPVLYFLTEKFLPFFINIIDKNSKILFSGFKNNKFNLIDLGCGSGLKASHVISNIPQDTRIRYCPVDISPFFVKRATERVRKREFSKVGAIKSFVSDFQNLDDIVALLRGGQYFSNFILLLGETIAHYDINDLLFKLSGDMFHGDQLLIGTGLQTNTGNSLNRYTSPLFNDWFMKIMEQIGFNDKEVSYKVRKSATRVEMYYSLNVDKKIVYQDKTFYFKKGDEVIIGTVYHFTESQLKKICKMYFNSVEIIKDKSNSYVLVLCRK